MVAIVVHREQISLHDALRATPIEEQQRCAIPVSGVTRRLINLTVSQLSKKTTVFLGHR